MPKQVNVVAGKPCQITFVVSLSEGNGAEDNQVVVDVEIGSVLVLEQSLVVGVHVEKLAVDLDFGASNEFAVENPVQVFEKIVGRNVPDVRGNGIGRCVVFERENPKRRAGIHLVSPLGFEIGAAVRRGNFRERHSIQKFFLQKF